MTIKTIEINNFRSIENLILEIETIDAKECTIFLGKNESGKSNFLKALALLENKDSVDYGLNCNKRAKKKKESINISFELSFSHRAYKKIFIKEGIPEELIYVTKIERKIDIPHSEEREDYFHIYLDDKIEEAYATYIFDNVSKSINKIIDIYQGGETLTTENIKTLIPNHSLISKSYLETIMEELFFPLLDANTPKVIFWQPSTQYLINKPIDLKVFKDDPSMSIPLRNIFHISGIDDENIKSRIELIEEDGDEERSELSETLSGAITRYVNSVWKEHKINIKTSIETDLSCVVSVEDQDNHLPKYSMNQRSDGFKQFISILLNLSAENTTSILKNKLILLDEPEVHLHPSGIKFLRDELLKISENNTLMVATHSVHMIDKLNLNRHYSVIKDKSVTSVHQIQENNPYEEEVIYESLGTSIYEHISPNMIIFEGKTDKDMFDIFSKEFSRDLKIKNISAISANGVDSIPKYVKFFDGKLVNGFVLVDSDKAGRIVKELVKKENASFNTKNTFEISDLIESNKDMTLEDLFPKEILEKVLKNIFELELELEIDKPFITQIKIANKRLDEKKLKMEILKDIINDFNTNKMTKIKRKEKYALYYSFIEALYLKINA